MKINAGTKRIAILALLTAMSLITFLIENLFPPLFIPGAKLGLSNAFSFAALVIFTPLDAIAVVAARTLLGALFAGNVFSLVYSFTAGIISIAVASVLTYAVHPKISLVAVSVVAACVHNFVQNAVFALLSQTMLAFSYAPYLLLIGALSGAFVGTALNLLIKRIPLNSFYRTAVKSGEKGQSAKLNQNEIIVNNEEEMNKSSYESN